MKKTKMTITILGRRSTLLITALIMIALLILPMACATISQQRSLKKVKANVEGAWILEEWYIKGQAVHPPTVEARFILDDNAFTLIMLNSAGETPWTWYGYGTYTLDASTFSMGFDKVGLFIKSTSGVKESHKFPWKGMKSFGVSMKDKKLHLGPSDDNRELIFDGDTLILKEKGKILRTYRRAGAK